MSDTTSTIRKITIHGKIIEYTCLRPTYRYTSLSNLFINDRAHQTHILPSDNCLAKINYLTVCCVMYKAPMYMSYMWKLFK